MLTAFINTNFLIHSPKLNPQSVPYGFSNVTAKQYTYFTAYFRALDFYNKFITNK